MTLSFARSAVLATVAAGFLAVAPISAATAAPFVSYTGTTDAGFLAYLAGQGVSLPANEVAVVQARGGNNGPTGDYEIGLHIPPNFTNANPVGTAGQQVWGTSGGSNPWVAFTLSRVGTTLTFAMGSYNQSYTDDAVADINGLGLRLRADNQGNRIGETLVRDLMLDGTDLGDYSASDNGLSFAVFEGFSGDFVLTGEASLNWTGGAAMPSGSRLGFQIKALTGLPTSVPEPATLALLGAGLLGLGAVRIRRRR